jgi:lincosamide nucleotidyltransferase B/F
MDPDLLLKRLDDIGRSLEQDPRALALLGLGSVGLELERLDAYSDLDFFVIVAPGSKPAFLADLSWLSQVCPVAYAFANTVDGYKLLFRDGIFCEFAVFEPDELAKIPFAPGRIVWKRPPVSEEFAQPRFVQAGGSKRDAVWLLGEALTNLFVGLARERRGERLSAARFIQGYAVDRVIELAETIERPGTGFADAFTPERRFEQRFPGVAQRLPAFLQGYERNRDSALAILAFLEEYFSVNPELAAAIRKLCLENAL